MSENEQHQGGGGPQPPGFYGGGASGGAPVALVTTRPDKEIAEELKKKMVEALKPVCEIMDEANKHQLRIMFDGIGVSPLTMKNEVGGLRVMKWVA